MSKEYVVVDLWKREQYPLGFIAALIATWISCIIANAHGGLAIDREVLGGIHGMIAAALITGVLGYIHHRSIKSALAFALRGVVGASFLMALLLMIVALAVSSIRADANRVAAIPQPVFDRLDLNHDGVISSTEVEKELADSQTLEQNRALLGQMLDDLRQLKLDKNSENLAAAHELADSVQALSADLDKTPVEISKENQKYEYELQTALRQNCGNQALAQGGCSLAQLRSYPQHLQAMDGRYYWLADIADKTLKPALGN